MRQYEEDIKEKGSQRNLPGWNFCTFFVLKEGLARGFESVGLVDDALMGYDELSVELISALREQADKAAAGEDASLFRDHTEELLVQAKTALETEDLSESEKVQKTSSSILDEERKPYRELILASNISAFDFRSYVFARQVCILLRIASLSAQAGAPSVKLSTNTPEREFVDPLVLTDICQRAIYFIASIGRILRKDLQSSLPLEAGATEAERAARYNVIENMVSSWTYTSAQQVLARTNESFLSQEVNSTPTFGSHPSSPLSPTSGGRGSLPARTTSLLGRVAQSPSPHRGSFSDDGLKSPPPNQLSPGTLHLAAQRAQLHLIARKALSAIAARAGWVSGWQALADHDNSEELDEISLDDDNSSRKQEETVQPKPVPANPLAGVFDQSLHSTLSSEESFYSDYEVCLKM